MEIIKKFLIWRNGICERCNNNPKSEYSSKYCGNCVDLVLKETAKELSEVKNG